MNVALFILIYTFFEELIFSFTNDLLHHWNAIPLCLEENMQCRVTFHTRILFNPKCFLFTQARVNEELVVLLKQQPDMCCLNSMVYVLVSLLTLSSMWNYLYFITCVLSLIITFLSSEH